VGVADVISRLHAAARKLATSGHYYRSLADKVEDRNGGFKRRFFRPHPTNSQGFSRSLAGGETLFPCLTSLRLGVLIC
jgi:hypothetical protein